MNLSPRAESRGFLKLQKQKGLDSTRPDKDKMRHVELDSASHKSK